MMSLPLYTPRPTLRPAQPTIAAPPQQLEIHWDNFPYVNDSGVVTIRNPAQVLAKLNLNIAWPPPPAGYQPSAQEFFREIQAFLANEVNKQLRQVEPVVNALVERAAAQERLLEEAMNYMRNQISLVRLEVVELASLNDPTPMDWEPTMHLWAPDMQAYIDDRIEKGIYKMTQHRPAPVPVPVPPPSTTARAVPYGLRPRDRGRRVTRSATPTPPGPAEPETPALTGLGSFTAPGGQPPMPGAPPRHVRQRHAPTLEEATAAAAAATAAAQAAAEAAAVAEAARAAAVAAAADDAAGGGDDDPGDGYGDGDGEGNGGRGGRGGRGGHGSRGGRGGRRGPAEDGGGDPDDSDNSDSDPELDQGARPQRWRDWVRRRAERDAMRNAAQFFGGFKPQLQPAVSRDCKVKDPEPFKGDPEDLERFLLQLENKFEMEPNRYNDDVRKI